MTKISLENYAAFETYLYIDRKLRPAHFYLSRYKIMSFYFGDKDFTRDNFNFFLADLKGKGYKNSYLNSFIKIGKHIARYYSIEGFDDYTYFKQEEKLVDVLTPDEVKALAEVVMPYPRHTDEINQKYRTIIYTLFLTGIRINELLTLRDKDILSDQIVIRGEISKSGHTRIIPIKPFLYDLLYPYLGERVFDITQQALNRELHNRAEKIGLKKRVYAHVFRHSMITHLIKQKVPIAYVAKLAGHSSIETTANIYTHAYLDDLIAAVEANPLYQEQQTYESILLKLKEAVGKIVDPRKCTLSIRESLGKLTIEVLPIELSA